MSFNGCQIDILVYLDKTLLMLIVCEGPIGLVAASRFIPGTHGKHQMFEFWSFESVVHDSAGRGFQGWIITPIIGAVSAVRKCPLSPLCLIEAEKFEKFEENKRQMLPQQIIPQLTTIPQLLHPQLQPPGWEKVDRNRFTCTRPLQTTGKLNKGICKGKTKQDQNAIAKWGTCDEHDILKEYHTHTNVIPYLDGECTYRIQSKAWFAMPVAETDLLQQLKFKRAKEHSQQSRGGVHAGISHMHKHGWVHGDIKPDNILIHKNVTVLADFGLTTKQGTGPTLININGQSQWLYPVVYPPYSTMELYKADVHVNRDWFAFTVVVYEMYLNDEINSESWWVLDKVRRIDETHSKQASKHYGAGTRLLPYMKPESTAVPAAAGSSSRTHRSTTNINRRQNSSNSVDAIDDIWDSYVKDGKMCRHAKSECENPNETTRFEPYLRTRTCEDAPISCARRKGRRQVEKTQKTQERGQVQQHAAQPPTRTATTQESLFLYMAPDGSHCSLLKDCKKHASPTFELRIELTQRKYPAVATECVFGCWGFFLVAWSFLLDGHSKSTL